MPPLRHASILLPVVSQRAYKGYDDSKYPQSKLRSDAKEAFDEAHLTNTLVFGSHPICPLRMICIASSRDGVDRSVYGPEPLAGYDALLHESMILLDHIVDVAGRSASAVAPYLA